MSSNLQMFKADKRFTVITPTTALDLYQDDKPVHVPAVGTVVGRYTVLGYVATKPNAKATDHWSAYVATSENPNGSNMTLKAVRIAKAKVQ
jgi:hypothetical protein